jgi:hypothetical protein
LCDVCRLLDGSVGFAANDGTHPWLCRVEGSPHAGFAYVQAISHRLVAAVDRNVPIVAKMEECVV